MALDNLALRILISAKDDTASGLGNARQRIQSISDQLKQLEKVATRFLSFQLFTGMVKDTVTLADSYKTLQARLQLVSDSTQEFSRAQAELLTIAQRTRSSLEGTYTVYGKLETVIKQLGGTQDQALATTETLNQAIALTSQGVAQDAAAIQQFSQALGSGVLRGDEFNSVMENSPGLAQALADGLGVPITKLREMAEAGQLTADKLVNALGQSAPKVAEQFASLPVTVGGALTQVNNAMLQFVGRSEGVNVAVSALSGTLQGLAKNFDTVANIAVSLGALYAGKLASGALESARSFTLSTIAAREKAAADVLAQRAALALLAAEAQKAAISVKAAQAMVTEAQLQRALASSTKQQEQATKALTAAINSLHAAQALSVQSNAALAAGVSKATEKTTLATKAFAGLKFAVNGLFAIPFISMIAEWLLKLDVFYTASMRVQEGLFILTTGIKAMMDGMSATDRWAQIQAIHQEFNQLIANNGVAAKQAAVEIKQAEDDKAKATEEAALKQEAAFAKVQAATKALTAQIDADAKQQTQAIQQALSEKLLAIDISTQLDAQKDQARIQAQLSAAQQELTVQQAATEAKLLLIDQEYKTELEKAQGHADRVKEIEASKKQAKLSVYQGLADFYAAEVQRLTNVYQKEAQDFALAKQSIEQLAASHQQRMLELDRLGMSEQEKIQSEQTEYAKTLRELKAELAKGDQADQAKVNELMEQAKKLQNEITQATVNGAETQAQKSSAIYEAKKRENEIYGLEKGILEANAKAHEDNAKVAQAALESNKQKLNETQGVLQSITDQLKQEYNLTIGLDQGSVNEARNVIADLVKPETKTITIETVNGGGGDATPAEQATGGLAGYPTGQPWRFNAGGWARMAGLLSGYGGGDRRKALLEDGEFIIRKEAVQKLGVPFMQAVNQGEAPLMRGSGGEIGDILAEERRKDRLEKIKKILKEAQTESANRFFGIGYYGDKIDKRNITKGSETISNRVTQDAVAERIRPLLEGLDEDTANQVLLAKSNIPKMYNLVSAIGVGTSGDQQKRAKTQDQGLIFNALIGKLGSAGKTAESKLPAFNIPSIPQIAPAMAAPAKTIHVQFKAPDGSSQVNAAFSSETDVSKMLEMIKQSGMRVGAS